MKGKFQDFSFSTRRHNGSRLSMAAVGTFWPLTHHQTLPPPLVGLLAVLKFE